MNWEAIGALSEFGGTVAVVVSLLYVAMQIRQNTLAIQGATTHAVTETQQVELQWSSEIAATFTKALETPDQLTSAEAWRLSEWLNSAVVMRQNEFRQFRLGLLPADIWEQSEQVIMMILSFEWGRNWWCVLGRQVVVPELAKHIDSLLEKAEYLDFAGMLDALKNLSMTRK